MKFDVCLLAALIAAFGCAVDTPTAHAQSVEKSVEMRALLVSQPVLVENLDPTLESGTVAIYDSGQRREFEVSDREYYYKDTLSKQWDVFEDAVGGGAESMRRRVTGLDQGWGGESMMVLYERGVPKNDATRRYLTHKIVVKFGEAYATMENAGLLARLHGLVLRSEEMRGGLVVLGAPCGGSCLKVAERLRNIEGIVSAEPLLAHVMQTKLEAPDPFFRCPEAWHLQPGGGCGPSLFVKFVWDNTGNTLADAYQGRLVNIAVIDDGVEGEHPDLERNYMFNRDVDLNDMDDIADPINQTHGTTMAGVIFADMNDICGVGVAPESNGFGVRLLGGPHDDEMERDATEWERSTVDVSMNGWGPFDGISYAVPGELLLRALDFMAGRGVAIIRAAGNGWDGLDRADYDGYATNLYTIPVGATEASGTMAITSEHGANVIVSGATGRGTGTGLASTDLTGVLGDYQPGQIDPLGNCHDDVQGTSAAAATVSGVVALMLQARRDLNPRDIMEILMLSGQPVASWFSDGHWDEFQFHARTATFQYDSDGDGFFDIIIPMITGHQMGSGFVDGLLACQLSEIWPRLSLNQQSVSEREAINEEIDHPLDQPLNIYFDFSDDVRAQDLRVEHAQVTLTWKDGETPRAATVHLISPLLLPLNDDINGDGDLKNDPGDEDYEFYINPYRSLPNYSILSSSVQGMDQRYTLPTEYTYTSVRHWGMRATGGVWGGKWVVRVANADGRTLTDVRLELFGAPFNEPAVVTNAVVAIGDDPLKPEDSSTTNPRLVAFDDQDIHLTNIELWDDFVTDELNLFYQWEKLNEDGLTWEAMPDFTSSERIDCNTDDTTYDRIDKIHVDADSLGETHREYFRLYNTDGEEIAYWFGTAAEELIPGPPPGALNSDRNHIIVGVPEIDYRNGGAFSIFAAQQAAAAIANGINNSGEGFSARLEPDDAFNLTIVIVYYLGGQGERPRADDGSTEMNFSQGVDDGLLLGIPGVDRAPNCFPPNILTLPKEATETETRYRLTAVPIDLTGREGFKYISPRIIVNSRPNITGCGGERYRYDADLWINEVPPAGVAQLVFLNEFSQGVTPGAERDNPEWLELIVNFRVDMRGWSISNDIATFDVTFADNPLWEDVLPGQILLVYNGDFKDEILPEDTVDPLSNVWVISSNSEYFTLPANGDGWGEFSNLYCRPRQPNEPPPCDGTFVSLLSQFAARDDLSGISFNGNSSFVDVGDSFAQEGLSFVGPDVPTQGGGSAQNWVENSAFLLDPNTTVTIVSMTTNGTLFEQWVLSDYTGIEDGDYFEVAGGEIVRFIGTIDATLPDDPVMATIQREASLGVPSGFIPVPPGPPTPPRTYPAGTVLTPFHATPGVPNNALNVEVLNQIRIEQKSAIPLYRFYTMDTDFPLFPHPNPLDPELPIQTLSTDFGAVNIVDFAVGLGIFPPLANRNDWDAVANDPPLLSGGGGEYPDIPDPIFGGPTQAASGDVLVVMRAGTTLLDGENDWAVGDLLFNTGTAWVKFRQRASDIVPGLRINPKTGEIFGVPNTPFGGDFNVVIQRHTSYSSEIQQYVLSVKPNPALEPTGDDDNDLVINLLEQAFGMNPFESDAHLLPSARVSGVTGGDTGGGGLQDRLSISYRRLVGGASTDPDNLNYLVNTPNGVMVYEVDISTDSVNWETVQPTAPHLNVFESTVTPAPDNPQVEVATVTIDLNIAALALLERRVYLRVKITQP